jgi:hypothetical protein
MLALFNPATEPPITAPLAEALLHHEPGRDQMEAQPFPDLASEYRCPPPAALSQSSRVTAGVSANRFRQRSASPPGCSTPHTIPRL